MSPWNVPEDWWFGPEEDPAAWVLSGVLAVVVLASFALAWWLP